MIPIPIGYFISYLFVTFKNIFYIFYYNNFLLLSKSNFLSHFYYLSNYKYFLNTCFILVQIYLIESILFYKSFILITYTCISI